MQNATVVVDDELVGKQNLGATSVDVQHWGFRYLPIWLAPNPEERKNSSLSDVREGLEYDEHVECRVRSSTLKAVLLGKAFSALLPYRYVSSHLQTRW